MRARGWIGFGSMLGAMAGAFGVRRTFRRGMADIRAGLEAESELLATELGPIEYVRTGAGPTVLVSHGAGGGYDQGLDVGCELLGFNFDFIAPSRFGYLRSPIPERNDPAAQADTYASLLDLLGVEQATLVGISAGAPSAIEMALRHPERVEALILLVPRAYAPGNDVSAEDRPMNRLIMAMMSRGADFAYWAALKLARPAILRFLGTPPQLDRLDPLESDRLTRIMWSILPLSLRAPGIANDGNASVGPWPLERIKAPTFVMSAEDDLFGTLLAARYTAQHIPNAELMVVPTGGHLLVGQTKAVAARIRDFLRRNSAAAMPIAA